ncbi:hypothetical protein Tco_0934221 [Tanacetum coccineum]
MSAKCEKIMRKSLIFIGQTGGATMPNTRSGVSRTCEGINKQIDRQMAGALGACTTTRNLEPLIRDGGGFVPARECTYQDFLKCQPLSFNETEGVFGLTRLFEKMETVFHISNCPERMVPNEEDKVERFVRGLPNNIQGNVIAAEPTKLQDAIRIANNLMDQKLKGYARSAKNKRRLDNNPRDNQGQQPVFKRQNVGGQNVYTFWNNEKKGYVGSLLVQILRYLIYMIYLCFGDDKHVTCNT